MSDDAELIAAAKRGDRKAFSDLVVKYQRRVYLAALHVTGNHSDADDVAQETFVKAYRHLAGFDGRSDLFTWLYRIAVNTALNHLRSQKRADRLVRDPDGEEGPRSAIACAGSSSKCANCLQSCELHWCSQPSSNYLTRRLPRSWKCPKGPWPGASTRRAASCATG